MLEGEGHVTFNVNDGVEALAVLEREKIDAVISDILMPNMDGYRFCFEMRKDERWRDIVFVFYTNTYTSEEDERLGFDMGADKFLRKPASAEELCEALHDVKSRPLRVQGANASPPRELDLMRQYSQQLVMKLEGQNAELSARTIALDKMRIAAEDANKAKDRFIAVLSHELRAPLAPVLAVVSYLAKKTSTLPHELRTEMEMIRRNVELEARLIDDLLDATKIANGKLQLDLQPTDAHDAIRQALDICAEDIKTKKLELWLHLDASAHHVLGDSIRLSQIFWNLISNAVKFTPANGRISVRSRNEGDEEFVVEIEDNGIGIETVDQPHIFDAFQQGGHTVTREFGGLGLGLAITKGLVESHNGQLYVFSEGQDTGSRFKLVLQAKTKENVRAAVVAQEEKETIPLRLLVVDDHEDTKRVLSRLLRKSGHEVFAAGDVASALEILEHENVDVLLSDLGLPDGTGHDLMVRAKVLQPLAGIAISGFGSAEDVAQALNAGFAHHLVKPVNFERLEGFLREMTPTGRSTSIRKSDALQNEFLDSKPFLKPGVPLGTDRTPTIWHLNGATKQVAK